MCACVYIYISYVCMHILNLVSMSQCFLPCCSIVTAVFDCVMYFDCRLLLLGCGMDLCFHSVFILPRLYDLREPVYFKQLFDAFRKSVTHLDSFDLLFILDLCE